MDCWEKKKIGANLKFNLGKPDQKDLVSEFEGDLLKNGGAWLGFRVPGKLALPEWHIW